MPPRKAAKAAAPTSSRSAGRAAKSAASAAIANSTPQKRGRTAKPAPPAAPDSVPKKRGRPARAKLQDDAAPDAVVNQSTKSRGRGRTAKGQPAQELPVQDVSAPKARRGRPPKAKSEPATIEAPATPKRRGRPSTSGLDLNRVAGPSRVSKRASSKKSAPPAVGIRSSPRTSRTRAPKQAKKAPALSAAPKPKAVARSKRSAVNEAPKEKKRLGRPPKNATSTPTKPTERKAKGARVAKPATKPRKKRGMTSIDVPDRFAPAMEDYLQQLYAAENPAADEQNGEAEVGDVMEDAQATPTHEDNGEAEFEEDVDGELDSDEEPILVFEEIVEEVIGDDDAAQETTSDTEVDEEEPVIVVEQVREISAELPNVQDAEQGVIGDASDELDMQQEIREVTASASQGEVTHVGLTELVEPLKPVELGNERNLDSVVGEREPVSHMDSLKSDIEDEDLASARAPIPVANVFGTPPADAFPTASPLF